MRLCCAFTVALGSLLLTAGCNKAPTESISGTVAIIDLDEIAKRVGADKTTKEAIQSREVELSEQLKAAMTSVETQLKQKQEEVGDQPTVEQKLELTQMKQRVSEELTAAKNRAVADFQQYRESKLQEFREKVHPVAREVARAKGLSIIITRDDSVYDVAPSVDITDEVAKRLSKTDDGAVARESTSTDTVSR